MTLLAAIDGGLLLQVVWVSLAAGVAVTVLFSFTVLFAARSAEARRGGAAAMATVWAVLAVLTSAAFAGGVIYGVHVMLTKS
jgi:hypothetical protein